MAPRMALWLTLHGKRIGSAVSESIGLVAVVGDSGIDQAIQFLLNEPAAPGGRLEFGCKAQVLGSPCPEPANALDADAGGTTDVLDVYGLDVGKSLQGRK